MLNWNAFLETLPIMGKGMLGIFIATAVIVLVIACLNGITGGMGKKKED